ARVDLRALEGDRLLLAVALGFEALERHRTESVFAGGRRHAFGHRRAAEPVIDSGPGAVLFGGLLAAALFDHLLVRHAEGFLEHAGVHDHAAVDDLARARVGDRRTVAEQ